MKKELSNCCAAPVEASCADEGTCCYICTKCEKACDLLQRGCKSSELFDKYLEDKIKIDPTLEAQLRKAKEQIDLEQKVYNFLYERSRLSFGVRCSNEDEWPIEEIAKFIYEEILKSYQEGFDNGAQAAASDVADAIACGRY